MTPVKSKNKFKSENYFRLTIRNWPWKLNYKMYVSIYYLLMWLGLVNSDVHKIIPSWNLFLLALFKSLKAFSWNTDQRYKYPSELKFKSVSKPWFLNQSRISASKNSKIIYSTLISNNFQRKTLFLKIRKSQKQIVVSSILPKINQKICQILP